MQFCLYIVAVLIKLKFMNKLTNYTVIIITFIILTSDCYLSIIYKV